MCAMLGLSIIAGIARASVSGASAQGIRFITPEPSECQAAPRQLEETIVLVATPTASLAPVPLPSDPLAGELANWMTAVAVTATLRQSIARANAADLLRTCALYTEFGLQPMLSAIPEADVVEYLRSTSEQRQPSGTRSAFATRPPPLPNDGWVAMLSPLRTGTFDLTSPCVFRRADDATLIDGQCLIAVD